ncbi:MAG: hypothetical protein E7070_10395 [Bacteroidales bacterium]|nr:hypothetical protein [Bacteroidales bacterium]
MTRGILTVVLLVISNIFMTFAWYGNFKLREMYPSVRDWPLIAVILLSWGLAFFEYCVAVPANRIGHHDLGGPYNLMQLKVLQESISLIVFICIVRLVFQSEPLHWNHIISLLCIVLAVFFAFLK